MGLKRGIRCIRYVFAIYFTISVVTFISMHSSKQSGNMFLPGTQTMERANMLGTNGFTPYTTDDSYYDDINEWNGIDASGKCVFNGSIEINLQKLKSIYFNGSSELVRKLGFNQLPVHQNTSLPVLVTAGSSKFYKVIQGLIKSVHARLISRHPSLKLIVFDLGFTRKERERMTKYCGCEVRQLNLTDLPGHVRQLGNYAFKPVIMNYIFQEFGRVWWLDSSVRFITNDIDRALKYQEENGALFFTYGPELNVALHTRRGTFRHLQENPCPYMYFGEIEAGNLAFVNSEVARVVLNRWVSCALDVNCIAPYHRQQQACRTIKPMHVAAIGLCHRFDQSVLSVILRRLYHKQNDYPDVQLPIKPVEVKRGQYVHYFPL